MKIFDQLYRWINGWMSRQPPMRLNEAEKKKFQEQWDQAQTAAKQDQEGKPDEKT